MYMSDQSINFFPVQALPDNSNKIILTLQNEMEIFPNFFISYR